METYVTKNSFFSFNQIKENKFVALVQTVLILWIFSIPLKNAFYQATTALLILLFLVHIFYYKQKKELKALWGTYKQLFSLFILFITIMFLSSFLGISEHKAFSEIFKYIYRYPLILFVLFYFYKQTFFTRKWFLTIIFIALFIHALDGIYQYFTGFDLFRYKSLYSGIRLTGAVSNPNPFGLVMAIGSIISLIFFLELKKDFYSPLEKLFYFFAFILFLFTLFYSQSRAAWMMFIFFFLGYIGVHLKKHGANKKLLISICSIVILIIIFFITNNNLHHRLVSIIEGNSSQRLEIWLFTITQIKENPVFGYGLESFKILAANTNLSYFAGTHNAFLEILLVTGIIGFSIFIYFVFIVLKESLTKEKILYGLFFLSYLLLLQFDGSLIKGKIYTTIFIIILFFIYSFRLDKKRSASE